MFRKVVLKNVLQLGIITKISKLLVGKKAGLSNEIKIPVSFSF
jgi:hypothetical protein